MPVQMIELEETMMEVSDAALEIAADVMVEAAYSLMGCKTTLKCD
jgi:hypothetical protein